MRDAGQLRCRLACLQLLPQKGQISRGGLSLEAAARLALADVATEVANHLLGCTPREETELLHREARIKASPWTVVCLFTEWHPIVVRRVRIGSKYKRK